MRIDTKRLLSNVLNYVIFFVLVAFVTTCCLTLFVTVFSEELGLVLTDENIGVAGKITFVNVALLALIFTVIDRMRRKLTVERSAKKIVEAGRRIAEGNFDVRVERLRGFWSDNSFDEIADCFNAMAEELSGVETLRTDFISNVSHEMKTPLSVIQNYCSLLLASDKLDDQEQKYVQSIKHSSRRLSDMISNILKLNKLENQRIYHKSDPYDLGEQLIETLLQFEDIIDNKSIKLSTDIQNRVMICADRNLLFTVWSNLLSNAFKFTDEGGSVSVSLSEKNGYATVSVSDTGCGINAESGARIFEKFYQADTSHKTDGNGLGLALVKRIIDILGADIEVVSEMGVGTTFTVRIRTYDEEDD